MGENRSEVLLGNPVVRLKLQRSPETRNRLVQPVETDQHHSEVYMWGRGLGD